jgi:hypothetical protein
MTRRCSLTCSLLLATIVPIVLLSVVLARADDQERSGAVKLLTTVPIPDTLSPLRAFDISWVDPSSQLYYLADRSNASVDVVDAKTNQFVKQIKAGFTGLVFKPGPTPPGGQVADNDRSGPNGVVVSGHWLFVTDSPSRVVSIDLRTDTVAGEVFTGGDDKLRADELAYDPDDGLLLVVNNADSPPFATLIAVDKQNGHLTLGARITFPTATNGAEQPVWDPGTRRFYQSIPEVNGPGDGTGPNGAVARINPKTAVVETMFPVQLCQPAGLTVGPDEDLLLGCSQAFDTAGQAWTASDANSAAPISVIMNAKTGTIETNVAGVSGNDEVWFNRGDGRYYLAARSQPGGPVLGVIDAESRSLVQVVPTINTAGKPTATPPIPAGTAHSVAVNARNNHALVPLSANNVFPDCLNGCIGVFGVPTEDRGGD